MRNFVRAKSYVTAGNDVSRLKSNLKSASLNDTNVTMNDTTLPLKDTKADFKEELLGVIVWCGNSASTWNRLILHLI